DTCRRATACRGAETRGSCRVAESQDTSARRHEVNTRSGETVSEPADHLSARTPAEQEPRRSRQLAGHYVEGKMEQIDVGDNEGTLLFAGSARQARTRSRRMGQALQSPRSAAHGCRVL